MPSHKILGYKRQISTFFEKHNIPVCITEIPSKYYTLHVIPANVNELVVRRLEKPTALKGLWIVLDDNYRNINGYVVHNIVEHLKVHMKSYYKNLLASYTQIDVRKEDYFYYVKMLVEAENYLIESQ